MRSLYIIIVVVLFKCANSLSGVDLSVLMSESDWTTEKISQPDLSFSVNHILFYNYTINNDGLESILTAWDNGIQDISVYMYPCIATSVYANSNDINCGSARDQFMLVFGLLNSSNVQFMNHSTEHHFPSLAPSHTPSLLPTTRPTIKPTLLPSVKPTYLPTAEPSLEPTSRPTKHGNFTNSSAPSVLPTIIVTSHPTMRSPSHEPTSLPVTLRPTPSLRNTTVQRMFVNVEDETPNRYFSGDASVNIQFLADLANEALRHGVQLGVYTTHKDWLNIMTTSVIRQVAAVDSASGLNTTTRTRIFLYPLPNGTNTTVNPFSALPLWMPRYDSRASMAFFEPFADWAELFMKQTSGGAASLRRVGSSRICTDYKEAASRRYDNVTLSFIYV